MPKILRKLIPTVFVVSSFNARGQVSPEIHWREARAWARFRRMTQDARANGHPAPCLASRSMLSAA